MSEFGAWLSSMSSALGYGREADLARALGLPQSTVLRWRRGARPSVEHLVRVSRVLRTDLVALLALAGHVPPGTALDPPKPPVARTETERRIDEAALPEEAKAVLRAYLATRVTEEDARVRAFLDRFGWPPARDHKAWLATLLATTLPADVMAACIDMDALLAEEQAKEEDR